MLSVSSSCLQPSLTSGLWTVGNMLVHVNAEGKNDGSHFITKLHNGITRRWLPWDATLLWIKHIIKEAWPGTWNNCSYFWFSSLGQGYWKDHMLKNTSDAAVINSFPPTQFALLCSSEATSCDQSSACPSQNQTFSTRMS